MVEVEPEKVRLAPVGLAPPFVVSKLNEVAKIVEPVMLIADPLVVRLPFSELPNELAPLPAVPTKVMGPVLVRVEPMVTPWLAAPVPPVPVKLSVLEVAGENAFTTKIP